MPEAGSPAAPPLYSSGDILVEPAEGGTYQVSRVSANGSSIYVLGYQKTEPAALLMAARATSGYQRVFLQLPGSKEFRVVEGA